MSYPSRIPETIDSPIFLLTPDGDAHEVARGFNYANGLAITPDGSSLIVAESFGHRLFELEIHDDGSLGNRRPNRAIRRRRVARWHLLRR